MFKMSASTQHGRKRSRSPDDYSKRCLLSKLDKRELRKLRVAIKRSGLGNDGPALPLKRDIEDFKQISSLVHVRRTAPPCAPPRVPIFSGDITVNQDFCEDRTVFTHDSDRRRSRSTSNHRSRSRGYNENRRSKSTDRYKRSKEGDRDRSRSRSRRKSKSSHRSRSRDRKRYRYDSREKSRRSRSRSRRSGSGSRRSRSRSRSSRARRPTQIPHEHNRRSVTPLRPGEYRPGHPDLALRKRRQLSRSRSRSPRYFSRRERSIQYRSPTKPVAIMENDFYEAYGQFGPGFGPMNPMAPYRQVTPGFYPRMYPHPPAMMMPRMPMPGYPRPQMPMFRHRLPVYNSRKIATVTEIPSQEEEKGSTGIVEQSSDKPEQSSDKPEPANSMEISSTNRNSESDTVASEAVTV